MRSDSARKSPIPWWLVVGLSALLIPAVAWSEYDLDVITSKGAQAPGLPEGNTFSSLETPVVNTHGRVAFEAAFSNGQTGGRGVWTDVSGTLELLVLVGDDAPGTGPGVTFINFRDLVINDFGEIGFTALLSGEPLWRETGIWVTENGVLGKVAQEGDSAPGVPDTYTSSFGTPIGGVYNLLLSNSGQVVFHSLLSTPGYAGIFKGTPSEQSAVALKLDPSVVGGIYALFDNPVVDSAGRAAFLAVLRLDEIGNTARGPFRETPTGLFAYALTGGTADGGGTFRTLYHPVANTDGLIAFHGSRQGDGINAGNDTAIWLHNGGNSLLLVAEGSPAPGTAGSFTHISSPELVLNALGEAVFRGSSYDGSTVKAGYWSLAPDGATPIAIDGDPAPLSEAGTVYKWSNATRLGLNAIGDVAYLTVLEGPNVDSTNDLAVYAEYAGEIGMPVRKGDVLEVETGVQTIVSIDMRGGSGNDDGRPSGFADNGSVAFWAGFSDGSHAVVVARPNETSSVSNDPSSGVSVLRTVSTYPAPFRENTTLRYELGIETVVRLTILDAMGRRLAERSAPRSPGVHEFHWNGKDDEGRDLPAGVYGYRIHAGTDDASGRLVKVR